MYWNLVIPLLNIILIGNSLDSCSEITNTILEKWNDSITADDIVDIEWNLKEFYQSFDKIKNKNF